MLLGSRVVCGPDWNTRKDSDSVEVGFVGTIINLYHFQDGKPLPKETVLVQWDTGEQTCCRAGQDGYYDLRILDSAPAGVKFRGFQCNGCQEADIAGMRWHCAVCPNYELCTSCYMNDVLDSNHRFVRFNNPSDIYNGIEVEERSTSFKIPSRGIFPGAKVRTKKDMKCSWTSPVLIGGQVLDLITWNGIPRSTVLVKWGEVGEQILRLGYKGKVDLELIEFARGPGFYPNHLPMVSVDAHLRLISKTVSYDKISREEITNEAENAINYLNDLLSTCKLQGKVMLCKVKRDIQEMQLAFEKSANIQKPALVFPKQENKKTERPPCEDMKDSQSSSTSDVALETNSFQNDNYSSVGTDTTDGGNVDNARIHHLVRKFSPDGDQQDGPLPENERKQCEVSEARQNVSGIISKFEKMTSYDMPNFDKKSMERPLYVNNKVTTVSPQNKNQDSSDDTFDVSTTPYKGKEKNEKACGKAYRSSSCDRKPAQLASYVTNWVPTVTSQDEKKNTFDVIATTSKVKDNKNQSKFDAKDEDVCADAASSSSKKTEQRAPYVPNKVSTLTSQHEKKGTDDMGTTFFKEKPKKENDICVKYVNRLVRRFEGIE